MLPKTMTRFFRAEKARAVQERGQGARAGRRQAPERTDSVWSGYEDQ